MSSFRDAGGNDNSMGEMIKRRGLSLSRIEPWDVSPQTPVVLGCLNFVQADIFWREFHMTSVHVSFRFILNYLADLKSEMVGGKSATDFMAYSFRLRACETSYCGACRATRSRTVNADLWQSRV